MQDQTQHIKDDAYLDSLIWGVEGMAPVIERSERATRHLIKQELIDVTKVGSRYVTTPRRLLKSVGVL